MPSSPAPPANSHDDQPVVQNPRILHIERVDIAPYTNTQLGDVINIVTNYHTPRIPEAERDPHLRSERILDRSWFKTVSAVVTGGWLVELTKARVTDAFYYAQHYASCTYQASLQFIHQMSAQNGCTGSVCLAGFLVNVYVFGGATTNEILMGMCHVVSGAATLVSVYLTQAISVCDTFNPFPTQYRPKTELDIRAITYIYWTRCVLRLDHIVFQLVAQGIIRSYPHYLKAHLSYLIFPHCIAVCQDGLFSWEWIQATEDIFCRYMCPGTTGILEVTMIMISNVRELWFRPAVYQTACRIAVSAVLSWPDRSQVGAPIIFRTLWSGLIVQTASIVFLAWRISLKQSSLSIRHIRHYISTQDYAALFRLRSQQR